MKDEPKTLELIVTGTLFFSILLMHRIGSVWRDMKKRARR